ncbi:MAG TPA: LacI family DNA-binding transcriptional regulator, partial [Actinotalea sp.]|nr:LacI family DNA-binding transcriptional regulator [Actinotalea sp.]
MGRVTLQTVADKVGVSRMTVSNAFSRPDQLSADLRATILAAAEELGYVGPDPVGRALARGSAGAVGVLLTESVREAFADPIAAEFFGAVAESLAPTGMAVALLPSVEEGDRVPARDVPIDGALVYACAGETPAVQWLRRRRLPLVYVDQAPDADGSSVLL